MKSQSQTEYVITLLKNYGYVDRNNCLEQRLTRLGAIICNLKKLGWDFRAEFVKEKGGKNFYYYATKSPLKVLQYYPYK